MYSTHKLSGILLGLALVVGGCNSQPMQQAENGMDKMQHDWVARLRPSQNRIDPVMLDPPADEAAQARAWDQSTFVYPNGAVLAYPTYSLNYEDRPKWLANDYFYSLMAPAILIYDTLTMPVGMIMESPTTPVVYHGARQPPTMTLAEPLQTPAQERYQHVQQERGPEQQSPPVVQPSTPTSEQPVKPEPADLSTPHQ